MNRVHKRAQISGKEKRVPSLTGRLASLTGPSDCPGVCVGGGTEEDSGLAGAWCLPWIRSIFMGQSLMRSDELAQPLVLG